MFVKKFKFVIICLLSAMPSCLLYSQPVKVQKEDVVSCHENMPSRLSATGNKVADTFSENTTTASRVNMKLVKGGEFVMGSSDESGRDDEFPAHKVRVENFWIDKQR
jgi:formylglycine-generating enzyme required for sulfatase activity